MADYVPYILNHGQALVATFSWGFRGCSSCRAKFLLFACRQINPFILTHQLSRRAGSSFLWRHRLGFLPLPRGGGWSGRWSFLLDPGSEGPPRDPLMRCGCCGHRALVPLGLGCCQEEDCRGKIVLMMVCWLCLCGRHLSCLTSGLLHFLLGEIPVCKLGDIFSQEAERKFLSSCDWNAFVLGSGRASSEYIKLMKRLLAFLGGCKPGVKLISAFWKAAHKLKQKIFRSERLKIFKKSH